MRISGIASQGNGLSIKTQLRLCQINSQFTFMACCDPDVKSSVEKSNPGITSQSETAVFVAIKRHAVISVAASVLETELLSMKQDHGDTILSFSARVLGKARNCKLKVQCSHGDSVDYSEEMVKHVVLAGMYDDEIKRKILSTSDIDNKSLNETIAIIDTEKMASHSMNKRSIQWTPGSQIFFCSKKILKE